MQSQHRTNNSLAREIVIVIVTAAFVGMMGGPGFALSLMFLLSVRLLEYSHRIFPRKDKDVT